MSNQYKNPEAYTYHLLFMFYPFCNNEMLKAGEQNSFCANLKKTGVINIINENKTLVPQFGKSLDEGFLNFQSDLLPSWNSLIQ